MKYQRTVFMFSLALALSGSWGTALAQSRPGAPLRSWYNCLTREVWSLDKQAWCRKFGAMQNAEYELPGRRFKLMAGRYEDPAQQFSVAMLNKAGTIALGDLNRDGTQEGVTVLVTNPGGTGSYSYLVATQLEDGQAKQLTMVPLGDYVQVESLVVRSGLVVVGLLTHGLQDQSCCPTRRVRLIYGLRGGRLQLLSKHPK